MKNSKSEVAGSKKISLKNAKTDGANLSNIENAIKGNAGTKTQINASKSLYLHDLKGEEAKKFRSKIRRKLAAFCNIILGKDRSLEEKKEGVAEFLKFYKANWKLNDLKIESFTQSKDESDLKDYRDLLKFIQESKGK